jgi:hypothetical protein
MLVLSGVWSLLLVIELTRGLSPWLQVISNVIWLTFVLQFAVEPAFLALYAFAVFGYVTAAIAAYFVGIDKGRTSPTNT